MKKFDYVLISVAIVAAVVLMFVITGKNKSFSSTPVEAVKKIDFDVAIKGATITTDKPLFIKGQDSFLTIRNVPHKNLKIINVQQNRKQIILSEPSSKNKFLLVDDAGMPNQFDFIVTLEDTAKITADGPVVGGNKIKIGIPVVLEGSNYKLSGIVSGLSIQE